jgi:GTP-binding protein EngB required for normal cell division
MSESGIQGVEGEPVLDKVYVDGSGCSPALRRLAAIAEQLGENSIAADLAQLIARINEGRFFVACVGQFKRGKSTLLNALVGEEILPTGVVPVTTVPTVLRYGEQLAARVLINATWQTIRPDTLSQYVSEELNPENNKRVEGVEVFLPSPLLASGMCLVDTPGIGSVFAGNTETTRDFLPQIDAAILVVGADPPISGEELDLIEAVAAKVGQILIVLNKIDRVSATERQQASAFAGKVVAGRLQRTLGQIYEVSAVGQLNNPTSSADWQTLMKDLSSLASHSGQAIIRSAGDRGVRRFSGSLQNAVHQRIRALSEPLAQSEQRITNLRQTVSQAEQSLRDLGALFSAEQMRLSVSLQTRRKQFLKGAVPKATEEFECEARSVVSAFGPARRRELMAIAQTVARRHVMPWIDTEEPYAEELYGAITQRFVNLVNDLLQRIAQDQSADFSHLPAAWDAEQGFRTPSRFFFHDMITVAQPASPLLFLADVFLGTLRVWGWFKQDIMRFLERLLDTNASRVQGDVEQRVVESRLRLESEVRKLLREVSRSAEQALSQARELLAAGSEVIPKELERLRKLEEELKALRSLQLTGGQDQSSGKA